MQYLIIGDIHGVYSKLINLLTKAGFTQNNEGVFHHPTIKAIFIGDLIDRGEKQVEVLHLVRSMVEFGSALIVMGNHELNAIGYATKNPSIENEYLRVRNDKNTLQHEAFLNAVKIDSQNHHKWIEWFKTLPLFLELENFNVIHAFWDTEVIRELKPYLDENNVVLEQYWHDVFDSNNRLFRLVETLLKGLEIHLPEKVSYLDKEGNLRKKARIKWWKLPENDLQKIVVGDQDVIERLKGHHLDQPIAIHLGDKPIFIGHYWMLGEPATLSDQVVCTDYSAINPNGQLVGYLYKPNEPLSSNNFICSE